MPPPEPMATEGLEPVALTELSATVPPVIVRTPLLLKMPPPRVMALFPLSVSEPAAIEPEWL